MNINDWFYSNQSNELYLGMNHIEEINMVHLVLTLRSLRARRKRPLSASVTTPSPARLKVSKKENKVMILPVMYQPLTQQKIFAPMYLLLLNLA